MSRSGEEQYFPDPRFLPFGRVVVCPHSDNDHIVAVRGTQKGRISFPISKIASAFLARNMRLSIQQQTR